MTPNRDRYEAPIRLEGDREARQLLQAVLEWSMERIDAAAGGCSFVSTRGDPTGEAWGATRALDPGLVRRIHRQLLPEHPSKIVEYLEADPRRPGVLEPDDTWPLPTDALGQLTADAGLTAPLVTVLHRQGRVRGLIWLCRDANSSVDQAQGARQLRRIHPLLPLAHVAPEGEPGVRAATEEDLVRLGLSERELAVARLAIAGHSNAMIASRLRISESTVKKHVGRVLAKTGVRSRTELMVLVGDLPT